jgi:aspartate aminotransferase
MSKGAELELKFPAHPVIHLEVGQPNFETPKHVIDATIHSLLKGETTYSPNNGTTVLREAVANKYNRDGYPTNTDQIVVTVGSSLSLYSLLMIILAPGDGCLVPLPGFPNYTAALTMLGASPIPYLLTPSSGYLPTIESLQAATTPLTRCIVLCNPGNPTGASYPKELLGEVIKWAHARNIFVLSDGECICVYVCFCVYVYLYVCVYGALRLSDGIVS